MKKQINLSIDGQSVSVPEGTLIVDAAKKIGIDIPVFCYHPKMEPVGMCRMCLVDIGRPAFDRATGQQVLEEDGSPKIQFGWKLETACTVPVSEGMVVVGMSEKVQAARSDIVEFLLTSHPLDCPVCDKGGECPLQNLTLAHGPGESRFLADEKLHAAKRVPLGDLIVLDRERCIQCARCIRFQDEIVDDQVLEFYNRGRATDIITNSDPAFDSYWSGNTTDICPVGALTTADFRFGARPWELKAAASLCSHCPVGCNLTYNTRREAHSGGEIVIKRAMPRQNESVNELWICDKGRFGYHFSEDPARLTQPLVRKHGELVPAAWEEALSLVAEKFSAAKSGLLTLVGGRLPNEDLYNLYSLTTRLGGKAALDTRMGGGDLTARAGLIPGSNLGELGAGDAILVVASDLEEEAPLWWLRVKQAAQRGATLIVANPRPTKTDRVATHKVRYAYGDESKTIQNFANTAAGKAFAAAKHAVIFYGSEGLGLTGTTALAQVCTNLLLQTRHTGKANNGLIGVWPRANDQGAWDIGFRPAANLQAKALYIVAADPVGDRRAAAAALQAADFVVVQELFLTETAKLADVVLPAQAYTEREGTFTSGERRVQRFYPVTQPRGESLPDFEIAAQIGAKAGVALKGRFPSIVFPVLVRDVPAYGELTYQKMAEVKQQWPLVGRADLFYGGTGYDNQQGLGVQLPAAGGVSFKDVPAPTLPKAALVAVPVTRLYDQGTLLQSAKILHPRLNQPYIALNPQDAERQKATDGMLVSLRLGEALATVTVVVDAAVPAGIALVPRSMGVALDGPVAVEIQIAETVAAE